ncbi:MAG: nuclear transport factor 2 family protein [Phycisphaeraceae bacterium]|nr:nuclear transport factor 2 family protein [Phycisphaeraceae bacterium]
MRNLILVVALAAVALSAFALQPERPQRLIGRPMDEVIAETLDDFHDAAAKADAARYFGHFTADAVFLGTDPTERWTVEEFRAWASPYFERDSAWTYHAVERHVTLGPCGHAAWFDEVVRNETYGDLRGTGVVVLSEGRWRIAQYNLTFQVPNEVAEGLLELVKRRKAVE